MERIPFVKYTSCGNSFVIIDEIDEPRLDEGSRARLAWQAVNQYFGVGCDNLLVLQRCTAANLQAINQAHGYWDSPPDASEADILFRMFEPNGDEALCCGNGLASIAHYLAARHDLQRSRILTEIPLPFPRALDIGSAAFGRAGWVRLPAPRPTPARLVDHSRLRQIDGIHRIESIPIELRSHDLAPLSDATRIELSAWLVFTGEPHLVVFPETDISLPELGGAMFSSTVPHHTDTSGVCHRVNFGTTLLRRIGYHLNRRHRALFPAGINLNVVRVDERAGAIEYRTYERGIERETLACGTGAVAAVHVTRALGLMRRDQYTVWPHRCRWYEPESQLDIHREDDGSWVLQSTPRMLFEGLLSLSAGAPRHEPEEHVASALGEAEPAELAEAHVPPAAQAADGAAQPME